MTPCIVCGRATERRLGRPRGWCEICDGRFRASEPPSVPAKRVMWMMLFGALGFFIFLGLAVSSDYGLVSAIAFALGMPLMFYVMAQKRRAKFLAAQPRFPTATATIVESTEAVGVDADEPVAERADRADERADEPDRERADEPDHERDHERKKELE